MLSSCLGYCEVYGSFLQLEKWQWTSKEGVIAVRVENLLTNFDSMFGFLLGATSAGAGMYYYVIDEYRVSNELLTEDIYVRLLLHTSPLQSVDINAVPTSG
jgi:hypothetical protein